MLDPRKIFSHKQAIRNNRELFSGRNDFFTKALDGFTVPGSAMAIIGERGVGKTSFAWQIMEILSGNRALVDDLGVRTNLPVDEFHCVWVQCRTSMVDPYGAILETLLSGQDSDRTIRKIFPDIFSETRQTKIESTVKIGTPIASVVAKIKREKKENKLSKIPDEIQEKLSDRTAQIESIFFEILSDIKAELKSKGDEKEILIFFDEFDQLDIKEGMGRFIKNCNDARVAVIGIADNINDILWDHESVDRKFRGTTFPLPNFDRDEVEEFFRKASAKALSLNYAIDFSPRFVSNVFDSCDGYPHLVQLLGYNSLYTNLTEINSRKEFLVSESHFDRALDDTLQGPHGEIKHYDQIKAAIGNSKNRAIVLWKISQFESGWVQEKELKKNLDVKLKRNYEPHLEKLENRNILIRDLVNDRLKFTDPVIRSVVRMSGLERLLPA